MGKRFTETRKWEDPFYRGLPADFKLALNYIYDRCDNAGVWEPDFLMAEFCIGVALDWVKFEALLGDRIKRVRAGKWWLTRFVRFQCGQLKPSVPPHRTVIKLLQGHGISLADPWIAGDAPPADPDQEAAAAGEPHAGIFLQLCAEQGIAVSRITVREKEKVERALALIVAAEPGAVPSQVVAAAAAYRKKYKDAPCTAMAIASHWSELAPAQRSGDEIAEYNLKGDEIARLRRELAQYMHRPFGVEVCKPDLTDEQIDEARSLKERIEELEKML